MGDRSCSMDVSRDSDNAEEPRKPNQFPEMFGKESAKAINVTNIIKLARELNKTWAVKA